MRQDAWTIEDDTILATVTLRHIEEGGTQLAAFDEVAKRLNRTPAACGYRWNASVRRQHLEDIGRAKQGRKKSQPELGGDDVEENGGLQQAATSWDEVLRFLRGQRREWQGLLTRIRQLERDLELAHRESDRLTQEKLDLELKITELIEEHKAIGDDYKTLLGIVGRARERVQSGESGA